MQAYASALTMTRTLNFDQRSKKIMCPLTSKACPKYTYNRSSFSQLLGSTKSQILTQQRVEGVHQNLQKNFQKIFEFIKEGKYALSQGC